MEKGMIKFKEFPLGELHFVENLIYYDGPILCHVKDEENDYFSYWVDSIGEIQRWLLFKVDKDELKLYLKGDLSLRKVILSNYKSLFIVDMVGAKYADTYLIPSQNLNADYLPSINSYYKLEIPPIYASLLEENTEECISESLSKKGFHNLLNKGKDFVDFLLKVNQKGNLQSFGC